MGCFFATEKRVNAQMILNSLIGAMCSGRYDEWCESIPINERPIIREVIRQTAEPAIWFTLESIGFLE